MQSRALLGLTFIACSGGSSTPSTVPSPMRMPPAPDAAPSERSPAASRCGRTPREIATQQDGPSLVVVDVTNAYWTNQNGGQVMSAPLDSSSPPRALAEKQNPYGIAIDATHVYWGNNVSRTGSLMRVLKQGGAPTVIADAQPRPYGLAVTSDALFWVNEEDGAVVRAAHDGKNRNVLARGNGNPMAIATDGRSVFWIDTKAGARIQKMSVDGGTLVTLAEVHGNPRTLLVHRS